MLTPLERYHSDPLFHRLVRVLYREFADGAEMQSGAGLTPSEVREACSLAWQFYSDFNFYTERNPGSPLAGPPPPDPALESWVTRDHG